MVVSPCDIAISSLAVQAWENKFRHSLDIHKWNDYIQCVPGQSRPDRERNKTMHDIIIKRTFAKRDAKESIGDVTLKGKAEFSIDGKSLPAASVEYLCNFALQSLQDAYAGAKNHGEAQAAFDSKLAKLVEGTIGARTGGGVDPWTSDARKVFRPLWLKALKAKDSVAHKDYQDGDAETRNTMLDEAIEANRAIVESMVEQVRAERAKLAKQATDIEL